jgi:GcrA cell cycle regulator
MGVHPNSPWPARDEELRALWDAGHSTAEIGRRMGLNKNKVVGRAHRLPLTPRPAAVTRRTEGAAPTPARVPRVPRAAPSVPLARIVGSGDSRPAPMLAALPRPPFTPPRRVEGGCRWPLGEPRTPGFAYCGDAITRGCYCADHAARAFAAPQARAGQSESSAPRAWRAL